MESTFVLTRCGDDLFCVGVAASYEAQALAVALRETGQWLEVIPGIDSVVVRFDASVQDAESVREAITIIVESEVEPLEVSAELLVIPVVYDGPDLQDMCEATGLSAEELIALHTGGEYTVEMIGFTPGFAFIGGLDERFRVARRKEPRARVAAGSVGIADGRTGLYAMASPGGWSIVGRTGFKLFDPAAQKPFALRAGMRVRFESVNADEIDS